MWFGVCCCPKVIFSWAEQFNWSWRLSCENPPENYTFKNRFSAVYQKYRCNSDTVGSYEGRARFDFCLVTVYRKWKFWWCLWVSTFPEAALSKAARLLGLRVRFPPGTWISVSCECCVLSGGNLCDGLITRTGESCRLRCVVWFWSWNLDSEGAVAHWGLSSHGKYLWISAGIWRTGTLK